VRACVRVCACVRACAHMGMCMLIFSVECCSSMCSIVEVIDRYYMDFIGFIQEQLVVKVNHFWVEGKMKVSFCVCCSLNGSVHVQNGFILFFNFCKLAVSMLQLIL
jgi:hypothetical protein